MAAGGATTSITAKAASVVFQSEEGMFQPGLANLFEPLGVICSAAHSIQVLRNDWVVVARQSEPINGLVAIITRCRCYSETHLSSGTAELLNVWQISYNDIGPGCSCWHFAPCRPAKWWHHDGFGFSTNKLCDLDRLHSRAHRNPAYVSSGVPWSPEHLRELVRDQKPPTLDAQQLRSSIVLVLVSFHVEKGEAGPDVAHSEIEGRAGRKFLENELLERCSQRGGEQGIRSRLGDKRDRTRLGTTQQIVKHENRKEGIGRRSEVQCDWPCHQRTASISSVEVDLHGDASVVHN